MLKRRGETISATRSAPVEDVALFGISGWHGCCSPNLFTLPVIDFFTASLLYYHLDHKGVSGYPLYRGVFGESTKKIAALLGAYW